MSSTELSGRPSRNPSTREFRSAGRRHVEIRRDRVAARHDLVHVWRLKVQRPDGAVRLRELAHTHPAPRGPPMWDTRLSRDREGAYRNTTLGAAGMAYRPA